MAKRTAKPDPGLASAPGTQPVQRNARKGALLYCNGGWRAAPNMPLRHSHHVSRLALRRSHTQLGPRATASAIHPFTFPSLPSTSACGANAGAVFARGQRA